MHWIIRGLWIVLIGWWLALIWAAMGILACCTVVLWPVGWKFLDSTYTVLTLDVD